MNAFACTSCGKTLNVRDEHSHKSYRCPSCGQVQPEPLTPSSNLSVSTRLPASSPIAEPVVADLDKQLTEMREPSGKGAAADEETLLPPQLLSADNHAAVAGAPAPAPATAQVAGHEILDELGRGGMGVVYKARHIQLKRLVALKMILGGSHAGEDSLTRFRVEAEAVARIQHSGIVQIHEVGEHKGLPFFSLEFCPGGSLAQKLKGDPLPATAAAQLVEKLAQAITAAHAQGIVHRDLKPANILLDAEGQPKITDFGLAKKLDDDQRQTASGSIMGTPSYMAPEQASGDSKKIGPASDLYALGAILYELLTGRPPFKGAQAMETLQQVINDEPVAPSRLQRGIPLDLETICLKCLHKDPARRYATALELAEDLQRFVRGEPVQARPVGRVEKTWRWCRRNPVVAGSIAAVALALLAASLVSVVFALRAERARQAETARAHSEQRAKQEAESARQNAQRQLIDLCSASGLAAAGKGDHSLALLWFARAVQQAGNEPEPQELNRIRMASWLRRVAVPEGSFTIPGFRPSQDRMQCFALSPDGSYLVVAASTGDCLVWDRREGRLAPLPEKAARAQAAAWEPRSGLLAIANGKRIQLLSLPGFQLREELEADSAVAVLAFSRDGTRLAWGGKTGARVWDRERKDHITPLFPHAKAVSSLSFSNSGELLATSAEDRSARVFRIGPTSSEPVFPPIRGLRPEHGMTHGGKERVAPRFTADDRFLLTAEGGSGDSHRLVWHSPTTGKVVRSIASPPAQQFLTAFALSHQGDRVAVLWESSGRLLDTRTGDILAAIPTDRFNWCEDVVFSADGKNLFTCGHDMMAQSWLVDDHLDYSLLTAWAPIFHPHKLVRAVLAANGECLATAQWDGTVCLWRAPQTLEPTVELTTDGTTLPALSPDGRFVLPRGTTYKNGTQRETRVFEARTGEPAGPPLVPGGILLDAVFSPDGNRVATSSSQGTTLIERNQMMFTAHNQRGGVHLWNWRSGKCLCGPIRTPTEPRGLAFSPDGQALAVVCADYQVVVISPHTGAILHRLNPRTPTRSAVPNLWWGNGEARFSQDGRFLVTWEMSSSAHVWDPHTGQLLHTLPHSARIESVSFHPRTPTILATAGRDSTARTWDLSTGRLLRQMLHPQMLTRVEFSPDGTELFTSCADGRVRVWDAREGTLGSALAPHPGLIDFAITSDRRWLISLGTGSMQITDLRTGALASSLLPLRGGPHVALRVPGGDDRVIVGGFSRSLKVYDLKELLLPTSAPAESLAELAELVAGRRILDQGTIVPLTSSEWLERRQRLSRDSHDLPLPRTRARSRRDASSQ